VLLLRLVRVAEYEPVVPDAVTLLSLVVGFAEVLQQKPRSVIVDPPSETTVPLPVAVVPPTLVTESVVTAGVTAAA
jgi:hypothetical protein